MIKNLLVLLLFTSFWVEAQQQLTGIFTPAENYKWGILYEVTPISTRYITDTQIGEEGAFNMLLDSTVAAGVYRFVYGVPPEEHNFEFIYNGKEDIKLDFSEEKGLSFIDSEENKRWTSYVEIMEVLQSQIDLGYASSPSKETAIDSLIKQQESVYHIYKNSSRGKLVASFINAAQPFVPDTFLEAKAYEEARTQHLLKTVRYNDSVLQKSGFLMEHSLQLLEESPFPFEKNLDGIASNLKVCKKEFQKVFMLRLWQRLQDVNKGSESNYLAEKHLIPLAIELGDKPLANELQTIVNTSIGAKAPNFSWTDEADKLRSLYDLKSAEHYILVFWSSTCSHCLKELPELQRAIEILPKSKYQVIAFGLEDDIYSWKNETYRLPDFLHVPGLGKWENETGNAYNISKTPTYFILNSEKVIVEKPEELSDLLKVINRH